MQAKFVGRWVPSGNNMTTGYPGSSFSFKVSGTHSVTIETSDASRVAYKIDDGSYVKASSGTVTITGLTLSTHTIKVVLTYTSLNNTWAGTNYATVSNVTVDQDGEIIAANHTKRRVLVLGDSITEGFMYVSSEGASKSASELTYWNKLGDMLSTDMIPCGIGGIGYVNSNTYTSFPPLSTNPSYIENINSSLVNTETNFDIILILLGVNDGKSKTEVDNDYVTAVTGCITRIKAKYPSADIHALIPFNNNGKPSLEQVYNAQGVHIIPQTWYSQITFGDSLHPNDNGHTVIANNLKAYFENYYGSAYFKEVTMKRIDTVYIDTNGTVQKVTGTMANNPVKPTLPSGAIKIADVVVEQGASTGTIIDNRDWLKRYDNINIVNVKDFGAVGDGVHDDTAAIQAAIDTNKIVFIPAGDYLVTDTITAKAPIIGAGYCRDYYGTEGTRIIANFSNDEKILDISEANYDFFARDFAIRGNGYCTGIYGANMVSFFHLTNIGVYNCLNKGIYINVNTSRGIFLDKITVFGAILDSGLYYESVGIDLSDSFDCRVTNIEVIGCCIGVKGGYLTYGSNWHIWCGDMAGKTDSTWWPKTIGILIKDDPYAYAFLDNIYMDTCHIGIKNLHGFVIVNNIWQILDLNSINTDATDSKLFDANNLTANNVSIRINQYAFRIGSGSAKNKITNVSVRSELPNADYFAIAGQIAMPGARTISDGVSYRIDGVTSSSAGLVEIAKIYLGYGACEITATFTNKIYATIKLLVINNTLTGIQSSVDVIKGSSVTAPEFYLDAPNSSGLASLYIKTDASTAVWGDISCDAISPNNQLNVLDLSFSNAGGNTFNQFDNTKTATTSMIKLGA